MQMVADTAKLMPPRESPRKIAHQVPLDRRSDAINPHYYSFFRNPLFFTTRTFIQSVGDFNAVITQIAGLSFVSYVHFYPRIQFKSCANMAPQAQNDQI